MEQLHEFIYVVWKTPVFLCYASCLRDLLNTELMKMTTSTAQKEIASSTRPILHPISFRMLASHFRYKNCMGIPVKKM